ncbi:MAG: hypothetical protein L0332_23130, partial [Chloroflexi bacterium]|nr:hypothetical protein [Chloroflexota bacterium]MCI0729585.1 hypothetical protein [Chloroflexota bacterium]
VVQINIGVADLEQSLAFYRQLGFQKIDQSSLPYPWAQLTDGQNLFLLNQDGNEYLGLGYFAADAARRVAAMKKMGVAFAQEREQDGRLFMAIFVGPGDLGVGLINHDPAGMAEPPGEPVTHCGRFGELAVAVPDLAAAGDFWNRFGFATTYQSQEPYPWGIFSDGLMVLGLHQTTEWQGLALTYFAGDMAQRIARLKEAGLVFAQEMAGEDGVVANAILRGPDGEQFFLFQEGMLES